MNMRITLQAHFKLQSSRNNDLQVRRMKRVKNRKKRKHMYLSSLGVIPPEIPTNSY
jgi:hypothetical protein